MSNTPPAWVVKAALPPVLNPENCVVPPLLVMTVALPPVLNWENCVVPPLLVMTAALPAVLVLVNVVNPPKLVVMTALPAVLLLMNDSVDMGPTKKFGAFEEALTMPAPAMVKAVELPRVNESSRREQHRVDRCTGRDRQRRGGAVVGERRRVVGHGRARTPVRARCPLGCGTLPGAVDRTRGLRGERGERAETGAGNKDES